MNQKLAIKLLLWLNAAVILFHLAILTKIIPYDVIWGGRLNNDVEMYVFEGISILVNLLLCLVLLIKSRSPQFLEFGHKKKGKN